jgi:hypothetical protein
MVRQLRSFFAMKNVFNRENCMLKLASFCVVLSLAISATSTVCADTVSHPLAKPPSQKQMVQAYMQKLVAAKTKTVGYVEIAKQHFKEDSAQYLQAQKLYIAAQSCQSGWLAKLTEAVRQGALKDLSTDSDFAQSGDECQTDTKNFVDFVDVNTTPSKGSLSWIGDAIDAAVKLWKAIKGDIQDGREAVAKRLETNATWPSWAAIGATQITESGKTKSSADHKP